MGEIHHRAITAMAFHQALVAAGVIRDGEHISRIVIDAKAGCMVVMHVQRYGDTRLLDVVRTLDGIEVHCEEGAAAPFDKGGTLPPGVTLARNDFGQPERVLPPAGE